MEKLLKACKKKKRNIIGLFSGTSFDGIDGCLARISGSSGKHEVLGYVKEDYPSDLQGALKSVVKEGRTALDTIAGLSEQIAEIFIKAAKELKKYTAITDRTIDAIASQGQIVWVRSPDSTGKEASRRSILQLCNASLIAKETGLPVISGFSESDICVGGLGFPINCYPNWVLFKKPDKHVAVVNIGGYTNVTVLEAGRASEHVWGFVIGPGNRFINAIVQRGAKESLPFDRDGAIADAGNGNYDLISRLLGHPFLSKAPPRAAVSSDFFNATESIPEEMRFEDQVATATDFIALSIYQAFEKYVLPKTTIDEIILTGGGANNNTLMDRLRDHFRELTVTRSDDAGVSAETIGPLSFAILGNETLNGSPANCAKATGAEKKTLLGTLHLP